MKERWQSLQAWGVGLFIVAFYFLPLNGRLLWQPDETRYAEISREMLVRGDWIAPQLLGLRYFEKPVAGYWINNISQWLFGDSNFAVRFGVAFCTVLSAALIFALAMRLWQNRGKALTASFIYLSCLLVHATGTYSILDPMLALWLTAMMVSFYWALSSPTRRGKLIAYALSGLACGMAFMSKGFLALVIPVISVLPYMIWQQRFKELLGYGLLIVAAAIAISAPWAIAIHLREPDYWHYFFWVEHVQRFAADNAQHRAPFWFFLPVLVAGTLPWLGLLPSALTQGWRSRRTHPELFYLLGWVMMPFLFFSIAKGKLPTYILPCFAPLALLMAHYIIDAINEKRTKALIANGWINLLAGLLAAIAIGLLVSGSFRPSPYQAEERFKIVLALASFIAWALIGLWSIRHRAQRWWLAALCPLLLGLTVGYAIPQKVMAVKQPQYLVESIRSKLADSRYILSNNVGVALGVAWELKRSDLMMYDRAGELRYGLDRAAGSDGNDRFIEAKQFANWLAMARKQGNVSLLLLDDEPEKLPPPDEMIAPENGSEEDRQVFLYYRQQP